MKKAVLIFIALFSTLLLAAAGDKFLINTNQDKDVIIQVNDGGVQTDALKVTGSTSLVTLGKSGETGTHTVNGALSTTGNIAVNGTAVAGALTTTGLITTTSSNVFLQTSYGGIKFGTAGADNLYFGGIPAGNGTSCDTACLTAFGLAGSGSSAGFCLVSSNVNGISQACSISGALKRCICVGVD